MGSQRHPRWDGKSYHVNGQGRAVIICGNEACNGKWETWVPPTYPPKILERKFQQAGWVIGATQRKNRCPTCSRAKRTKKEEKVAGKSMGEALASLQKAGSVVRDSGEPRQLTKAEERRVFTKLNEVFDETKGQYVNGYDDKSVARMLDLPWALVAKLREESGLVIKGDPVILGLRQEATALRTMLEDLELRIKALEKERGL